MILVIDNYDSFTYNLVQLAGAVDADIRVVRNDAISVKDIRQMKPDHIILSPGPGHPKDAGICEEAVTALAGEYPILGVCLGHQAICEAFGTEIGYAHQLMHGKKSLIRLDNRQNIFIGLPQQVEGARYHSLAACRQSLSQELQVIGETLDGEVMAVRHRDYDVYGLQFHPESILTPSGDVILRNFLSIRREKP